MERKKSSIIIVVMAISFLIIYSVNAYNKERTIGKGEGKTLYVGGSGPDNYSTIQGAINAAAPGDTIYIYGHPCPYYERLKIKKDNITLIGENRNTTIIKAYGENAIYIKGEAVSRI